MHRTSPVDRLALGLEEQRVAVGLSPRQLGELAGYSDQTVRNIEAGRTRNPITVTRLRLALIAFELYGGTPRGLEEDLVALLQVVDGEGVAA